jgi:hypothetical protein
VFEAVNGLGSSQSEGLNLRATVLRLVGISLIIPGSLEAQKTPGGVGALEGKVSNVPNETAYVPGASKDLSKGG